MTDNLRPDEMLLAKDHCLLHKGPVAFYGELVLSSQRVLFEPKGKVNKLAGIKGFDIPIETIQSSEILGFEKNLTIKTEKKKYRFSGRGAHRIHERLDIQLRSINGEAINLADIDMLNERVVLQGDVDVYLKGRLHTTGQLILTAQRIRIESLPSLETMIFSQKSLSSPVHDLKTIQYESISKRLVIETKNESIAIGGNLIPNLFLILESIRDGDFNSHREIIDCTFIHGQVHIHGGMLQTSKRILFCPKGRLDSIAGANAISIKLNKISSMDVSGWPDAHLKMKMINGNTHEFASKDPLDSLNSLIAGLSSFPTQPLFKDLRDGIKGTARTKRRLARVGVNVGQEDIQLVEWVVRIIAKEAIQMGWLLLTNECCRFISLDNGVVWNRPVTQITRHRTSRHFDPVLSIQSQEEKWLFIPKGGTHFNKTFWAMVMGIKPEQEGKIGRKGQGLHRVIGKFRYLNIFKEDTKLMGLTNVVVLKKPQGLRIEMEKMDKSPFKVGDHLMVEVPRNEGRFKYNSTVTECYLSEPDPIGRHYLTLEKPTDVIVFNQRTAFRVHFAKQGLICCFITDPQKKPGDFRLLRKVQSSSEEESAIELMNRFDTQDEKTEETDEEITEFVSSDGLNSLGILPCRFFDISLGGCSFVMKQDLRVSLNGPSEKLVFKLVIPFESGDLSILARLVGVRQNVERQSEMIHGCQFFNVNKTAATRLKREIIRLEREHIRELLQSEITINRI